MTRLMTFSAHLSFVSKAIFQLKVAYSNRQQDAATFRDVAILVFRSINFRGAYCITFCGTVPSLYNRARHIPFKFALRKNAKRLRHIPYTK
jgi:hypothetical protein